MEMNSQQRLLVSTQMRHYKRRVEITEYYLMLIVDMPLLVGHSVAEEQ